MALYRSALWFSHYLLLRLPVVRMRPQISRNHLISWQDASGESRRIGSVLRSQEEYMYTFWDTPESLWARLLPRRDHQIQVQELLGVILTYATFREKLSGAYWTAFVDNQSVEKALIKAAGGNTETNELIGRLWPPQSTILLFATTEWRAKPMWPTGRRGAGGKR